MYVCMCVCMCVCACMVESTFIISRKLNEVFLFLSVCTPDISHID